MTVSPTGFASVGDTSTCLLAPSLNGALHAKKPGDADLHPLDLSGPGREQTLNIRA